MKKYLYLLTFLLIPFLLGAAPTRVNNFSTLTTIRSSEVNEDFNNLYGHFSKGVTSGSSYWFCAESDCQTVCQADINGGIVTSCTGSTAIVTGSGNIAADTIWDAKGDLAVGTASNTASRLAVGANDTVLTADSTAATGVKWAAATGGLASTDIDTYSELNAIVADVTLTHNGLIDTFAELNTIVADQTLVHSGSNIATATALAANGGNCTAGSYPLGVDASGAVESCTDATTEIDSAITTHNVANNHIDWTADQGATNIHTGNYPITDAEVPNTITIDNATTAANLGADGVDALTEIAQGIKTAANDTSPLVVGTAGGNGEIAKWNTDGTLTDSNVIIGTVTDGKWCSYASTGTLLTCTQDAPAGSGDVTAVGDCASGDCFTGTSGTVLTFAGATSGTTALQPTAIAGTTTLTLPAATDTLVGKATTDTFTNKTFDANGTGNSISNIETADVAAASKSGSDTTLVTGTKGSTGEIASWNADGDLVDNNVILGTMTNGKWCSYNSTGTLLSCTEDAPAGSGDITSVGDVASGAAFDGTQGTTLTFYNVGGNATIAYDGTNIEFDKPILTAPTATPSVDFYDSDATAGDINAQIAVNCTDVGNGTEDCDMTFTQQIAGTPTNFMAADADGVLTISKALALGANNLTMTGSLSATGSRVTKGWFTDIESTNMPTVGGTAILSSLTAPQFTTIELGHATENTLSAASGVLSIEGVALATTAQAKHAPICKTIETPADADNFMVHRMDRAATITSIDCIVEAATSAVITVQECDTAGDNCAGIDGATTITCDIDGATDDGSLSNAGVDDTDWIRYDIGTVTGTVGHLTICTNF